MSDTSDSDESGSTTNTTSPLGVLLKTSAFSDLTLTCHGREIKVHKNILYAQSEYFRKMLIGPFKESSASVIDFPEDDPEELYDFIHYLYHLEFRNKHDGVENVLLLFRMYVMADKYNVASMRERSLKLWKDRGAFDDLLYGECQDEPKGDGIPALDRIVEMLRDIDAHPHNGTLWELAVPIIARHIETFLLNEAFKKLLCDLPDLNLKLLGWNRCTPRLARKQGRYSGYQLIALEMAERRAELR